MHAFTATTGAIALAIVTRSVGHSLYQLFAHHPTQLPKIAEGFLVGLLRIPCLDADCECLLPCRTWGLSPSQPH